MRAWISSAKSTEFQIWVMRWTNDILSTNIEFPGTCRTSQSCNFRFLFLCAFYAIHAKVCMVWTWGPLSTTVLKVTRSFRISCLQFSDCSRLANGVSLILWKIAEACCCIYPRSARISREICSNILISLIISVRFLNNSWSFNPLANSERGYPDPAWNLSFGLCAMRADGDNHEWISLLVVRVCALW